MFGQKLKIVRQAKNITTVDIAKDLELHQTTVSYFETREPVPIDLYLNYLAKQGIDLTESFKINTTNTAKILKEKRQNKKISWRDICDHINVSQSSLSYMENRPDTNFFIYLRYLVNNGVDINSVFS